MKKSPVPMYMFMTELRKMKITDGPSVMAVRENKITIMNIYVMNVLFTEYCFIYIN